MSSFLQRPFLQGPFLQRAFFQEQGRKLLNFIMPPACGICAKPVSEWHGLCPDCWGHLQFITNPFCHICGFPLDYAPIFYGESHYDNLICGVCLAERPNFHQARAALIYDDAARDFILPFKHADRTDLLPLILPMFHRIGRDLINQSDVIAPMPLHYRRLMKRKYNQSALISDALAKDYEKPHIVDLVKRIKNTKSQGHLTYIQRHENVKNAFQVNEQYRQLIENRVILIIDDVMTSGASFKAITDCLLQSGAQAVNCLSLARVKRGTRL